MRLVWISLALSCAASLPAQAQDRTEDNAVTQAEDAFGFSTGRESIGIYSAGNARGFSPTTANNVLIEGLYFDPAFGLPSIINDSPASKSGCRRRAIRLPRPAGSSIKSCDDRQQSPAHRS